MSSDKHSPSYKYPNKNAQLLRDLVATAHTRNTPILMPCAFDPLSAKLIQNAGFPITFMSGFSTAASRGMPDTGLISYGEMLQQASAIASTIDIPFIADGDTGYGNTMNLKRTVEGYARAGCAGIMIEDQTFPKRCGHTKNKSVVREDEALLRIQAAVEARKSGTDIFILARTDSRYISLETAIHRCRQFHLLGADMTFLEAPLTVAEMTAYCTQVPGPKMANMIENGGLTPILSQAELGKIGYAVVAYPLTLIGAAVKGMMDSLALLKAEQSVEGHGMAFGDLCKVVGFENYWDEEKRYEIKVKNQELETESGVGEK